MHCVSGSECRWMRITYILKHAKQLSRLHRNSFFSIVICQVVFAPSSRKGIGVISGVCAFSVHFYFNEW